MLCISSENISEPKIDTLRWSAITLLKDTFRSSNIDILRPKGISFPTIYNTKLPPFDTKLIHSHRLFGEILFNMKKMSIVRQSCIERGGLKRKYKDKYNGEIDFSKSYRKCKIYKTNACVHSFNIRLFHRTPLFFFKKKMMIKINLPKFERWENEKCQPANIW